VSPSAQEAFKQMLRDHVAPALRTLGLKGSGAAYSIPSESHWALIGFQGSRANTSARMKFTVNCKVVRKGVWAAEQWKRYYIGSRRSRTCVPGTSSGRCESVS
jgi:Domain of unknown function (DUF4304)